MANNYLEKFSGLIGKRQSEQIFKLLNKQRNSGQIRTLDEFASKLEGLIKELTTTTLLPSLKLFLATANDIIDEETFNFMLERVEDDLVAAFEEANQISEVQEAHEAIVRDIILKSLKSAVDELEAKISLFEFINKDTRGFDNAIFSTFKETTKQRTPRGSKSLVRFTDPRTEKLFSVDEDAAIDIVGERLVLNHSSKKFHETQSIRQIFDEDTAQSTLIVEVPGLSLDNVIDSRKGTYWAQSVLFTSQRSSVKTKLEFDLGSIREVNFIEIEPAVEHPVTLDSIHYIDSNGISRVATTNDITIDAAISVVLQKIAAKKLILVFSNANGRPVQFEYEDKDTLLGQSQNQPATGHIADIANINSQLDEIISSPKVKDLLGVDESTKDEFNGYEFRIGFDNVRIGFAQYQRRGIYISKPLEVVPPARAGITVKESRPYIDPTNGAIEYTSTTYDLSADKSFLGSIEYWIIRQDFKEDEVLIRTTVLPAMPLGTSKIHHERLLLTEKSSSTSENDIGTLLLFTNKTDGLINVFRNGEVFPNIDSDTSLGEGWVEETTLADRTPNNNTRMRYRIRVKGNLPGDIYTVSYAPLVSSTVSIPKNPSEFVTVSGLQLVDLVGDMSARLQTGKVITLDKIGESSPAVKSKLFLCIIPRRNTADSSVTPIVEEYTFAAGKVDPSKLSAFGLPISLAENGNTTDGESEQSAQGASKLLQGGPQG